MGFTLKSDPDKPAKGALCFLVNPGNISMQRNQLPFICHFLFFEIVKP